MVSYGVSAAYWDVRIKSTDTKPIKDVPNGSSLIFIDNQSAGMMLFDADEQCWIDKEGNKWTQ